MIESGAPIVVVSGLPRAGTSMAMGMLDAAGLPIMSDGVRAPDDSNPRGYYEYERVKELDKATDKSWLEHARGKAIKIISFLLRDLPETNDYRVIFMHRTLEEVIASQDAMLRARGEPVAPPAVDLIAAYQSHLSEVSRLLRHRACFTVLDVNYRETLADPMRQATRIAAFLDQSLDTAAMAATVDLRLHRHRT